jgi:SAM-dependent methyltransferase
MCDATVARVGILSGHGRILELGVGTGRLALPMAGAGLDVVGIDASDEMLDALRAKDGANNVHSVLGDMAALPFAPTFSLVLVAFNTLFNLVGHDRIEACFVDVERVLLPDGMFVVEAFVPSPTGRGGRRRRVRSRNRDDAVVLTAATRTHHDHLITGSHIEIGPAGIRLRPWKLCYATPAELDAFAGKAGLELATRHGGWHDEPFDRRLDHPRERVSQL